VQTQMFEMFIQDRATRYFNNGAFERASMIEGRVQTPLSRFTMYENGDISREDITKKVRDMLLEAEEKEKEPPRSQPAAPRQKQGGGVFADFWARLWSDDPEPEIQIGAPDHASFKKVPHPNQEEAYQWLRNAMKESGETEGTPEWKSAEIGMGLGPDGIEGDKPEGRALFCLAADGCQSADPDHWVKFQHVQKLKEGPVFFYVRTSFGVDKWQPRWCMVSKAEILFFKGNDNPQLLGRHEAKNVKVATLRATNSVLRRNNCIEIERKGAGDERVCLSTPTIEEARAWLAALKQLGIPVQAS